jgi:hypothetical protein
VPVVGDKTPPLLSQLMNTEQVKLSRREFVKRAGGAAGVAVIGSGALGATLLSSDSQSRGPAEFLSFHSLPGVHPAGVEVSGRFGSPGHMFVAPGAKLGAQPGPMILDEHGGLVWFKPLSGGRWATNFRTQSYRGKPVLTWWEGTVSKLGYGRGEGVIADTSYRELARIRGANGRVVDMHELLLTSEGTALFTCYPVHVHADLSVIGGPRSYPLLESVFQEVDIGTGRLVREWRSLDHVSVAESYRPVSPNYDYMHANSIDVTPDGNLLVSARNTWAVYKLDRRTGDVIWRLGGKRSHFRLGHGVRFTWQHDARQVGSNRITVFDDGFDGRAKTESQSRAVVIELDYARRHAKLVHSYPHPNPALSSSSMGNVQAMSNGDLIVGWGSEPYVTEFAAAGRVRADLQMPSKQQSYRAYRLRWRGHPTTSPRAAADRAAGRLYVSWNGATDVARWRVDRGAERGSLRPHGHVPRSGFETSIPLGGGGGFVAVTALDAAGRALGASNAIKL